jgi:arsenical pump membrane protein
MTGPPTPVRPPDGPSLFERVDRWPTALVGAAALIVAVAAAPHRAGDAAGQVWPPFVLVTGLLLVGLVADGDGLFARAGRALADLAPGGRSLFVGGCLTVAVVTAVLNLDTAVVFLTPVFVHAGRRTGTPDGPLVVACILVANAASLLLPGSNLTNLLVLGHLHLTGGQFLARMALPWTVVVVVTVAVVAGAGRLPSGKPVPDGPAGPPVVVGLGAAAVVAATVAVLVLRDPAIPVLVIGAAAAGVRVVTGRARPDDVGRTLGVPVLVALFGIAVALGTLGRSWSEPSSLLAHLDAPGTAVVAALTSVLVNNLPAASLLAARTPPHPFALLLGLDVGPNLFVTGSLAWVLWWRTTRSAGVRPPTTRAVVLGLVSAPVAVTAGLVALSVTGLRGH